MNMIKEEVMEEIPVGLRQTLLQKVGQQVFDAGKSFQFGWYAEEEEGPEDYHVLTAGDLEPDSNIWLIDHCWGFETIADGSKQLAAMPAVGMRLLQLMGLDGEDHVCYRTSVIVEMVRYLRQIKKSSSCDGGYFVLDELGETCKTNDISLH
jgi:hypothetical protein